MSTEPEPVRGPWTSRDLRLALLPAAILTVIALAQVVFASSGFVSPWKGGGFGMFSSLDSISNRPLRVFAETDRGRRPVNLPPAVVRRWNATRGYPSDAALRRVADGVREALLEAEPTARAVIVEIWRGEFESQSSAVRMFRWRSLRVPLDQGGEGDAPIDLEPGAGDD